MSHYWIIIEISPNSGGGCISFPDIFMFTLPFCKETTAVNMEVFRLTGWTLPSCVISTSSGPSWGKHILVTDSSSGSIIMLCMDMFCGVTELTVLIRCNRWRQDERLYSVFVAYCGCSFWISCLTAPADIRGPVQMTEPNWTDLSRLGVKPH